MKNILTIIIIIGMFVFGIFIGRGNKQSIDVITKIDTITINKIDTIKEIRYKTLNKIIIDTANIYINDTVFIPLPIIQKEIKGDKFKAWISGIRPNLDSIEIYNNTEIKYIYKIEKTTSKKKKWGVGIQFGYGATLNNKKVTLNPYIGIGVQYNILNF